MATKDVQISAVISRAAKDLLERHTRATGVKKGHLIELALLHHLRALDEIPVDLIIPPRLVVSRKAGDALLKTIERPRPPTKAMKELMGGD